MSTFHRYLTSPVPWQAGAALWRARSCLLLVLHCWCAPLDTQTRSTLIRRAPSSIGGT